MTQHRSNEASKRLETIQGIGVIGATAIAATVADPTVFRSGRDFAALIGLVPRQDLRRSAFVETTSARTPTKPSDALCALHNRRPGR